MNVNKDKKRQLEGKGGGGVDKSFYDGINVHCSA